MGWFSNPKCPRCGRETSYVRDMFDAYYTCYPCANEIHEEKERQEKLENRIKELERKLDLK
jgi:tRNA(Ile2) C34 agmatinyltransferase TiaS